MQTTRPARRKQPVLEKGEGKKTGKYLFLEGPQSPYPAYPRSHPALSPPNPRSSMLRSALFRPKQICFGQSKMGPMGFDQNKIVLGKTIMIEALNLCFGQNKKVLTKTKKFWEKPFPKISREP